MSVVVCGEALIDLASASDAENSAAVTSWRGFSAGGPMNTAIALARLGVSTQFLGRFGTDAFADQLQRHLKANGVDLDLAVRAEGETTSIAVVSVDDIGHASYAFHLGGTANFGWRVAEFPTLSTADWFHTGSLTAVVEPGRTALLDLLATTPARLSLDLNVRPTVITDPVEYALLLDPFLQVVGRRGGVVRASDEDLGWLAGDPSADPRDLIQDLAGRYECSLVVMTTGGDGALACGVDQPLVQVSGFPVRVIDTVGAGDTFTAGFLQGWLDNQGLESAMRRGCAAASIVCGRQGANPPSRAEVDEVLLAWS